MYAKGLVARSHTITHISPIAWRAFAIMLDIRIEFISNVVC